MAGEPGVAGRRTGWNERGSTGPFIMILLAALVGLVGLAYDGGLLFTGRREANNVAAAAARAGTNDLDEPSIYAGDPIMASSAPGTAESFALGQGVDSATAHRIDDTLLEVTVTMQVELEFLSIVGLGTQTVTGEATSRVQPGVEG